MLYTILKPVMQAALRLYFSRVEREGLEGIDNGKPTLILANHTASFMDAVVIACYVKRPIHFFTRGDVFANKWADKALRSLGLLPVYRINEGRDKLHLNENSNNEALEIFKKGGAVLIFAEGGSDIDKVLTPLKKGPFRLAAIAATTLPEPPMLVSLGINYSTPVNPFGELFLIGTPPIPSTQFFPTPSTPLPKAATEMMRHISESITPLVWHIDAPENVRLGDNLLGILKDISPRYTFTQSQALFKHLNIATPEELQALRTDWTEYHLWQRQRPLNPHIHQPSPNLLEWLLFIILIPAALIGLYCNRIPIQIAQNIADKKVESPDFWAPVFLSLSVVVTILWYLIWFLIGALGGNAANMAIILAAVAISGIIYLKVYKPIFAKAVGVLHRLLYKRRNPSHAILTPLRQSIESFVKKAL